ncbi:hypothetical protein H0E86_33915 [Streptomyces sp. SCSIO-PteL053]|nr:hypothetical protein H0E86_33915 [Streptomyces sp. SCSIO-PteL053]
MTPPPERRELSTERLDVAAGRDAGAHEHRRVVLQPELVVRRSSLAAR